MKQYLAYLTVLGALAFGLIAPIPASAGPAEIALLSNYIGEWSGSSQLLGGAEPQPFTCRLTINKGNQSKINYAGRCTLMGGTGAGQTTKLFNQALCAVAFVAVAEITAFARRAGVDASLIPQALAGGRADSRILQEYMTRMATGDGARSGRIDTMVKDLGAVAQLARATSAEIPTVTLAAEIHAALVARGFGADDPANLIRYFE